MTNDNDGIPPVEPTPATSRPDPYAQPGAQSAPPLPGQPYAGLPARRTPILSLLSLIAGIVSILGLWIGFIPFLGFFLGIWFPAAAVVLGFLGRKRERASRGMWLTGLILGFVGLAVAVLALILWIIVAATGGFDINTTGSNSNDYVGS